MSEHSVSVVQLSKKLLGDKWILGFEVLIDITGEFRKNFMHSYEDCNALLFDTVLEMRLVGRLQDAKKLQHLSKTAECGSLGESSSPILTVMLLCAQNLRRKKKTDKHQLHFNLETLVNNIHSLSILEGVEGSSSKDLGFFPFPLGIDDIDESDSIPSRYFSTTSSNATYFEDSLAAASRYALELETQKWENAVCPSRTSSERETVRTGFPSSIFDFEPWKKCKSVVKKLIVQEPITDCSLSKELSRDEQVLQHVFCRCICGPEFDEIVAHPGDTYELNRLQAVLLGSDELSEETKKALLGRTDTSRQRRWAHELLTTMRHSHDEVTEFTMRSSAYGALYQDVLSFSKVYARHALGRSLKAVISFTEEFADDYYQSLLECIQGRSILPRNKPWALLSEAESKISDMFYLGELLSKLESTDGLSCSVLNVLMKYSSQYTGSPALNALFVRVLMTYMDFVWDWFFEASCRIDSRHEFFGTVLGLSARGSEFLQTEDEYRPNELAETSGDDKEEICGLYPSIFTHEQALFLIRAGRSRSLLQYFGLENGALAKKPAFLNSSLVGNDLNLCRAHLESYGQVVDSVDNIPNELALKEDISSPFAPLLPGSDKFGLQEEDYSPAINGISVDKSDTCEDHKDAAEEEFKACRIGADWPPIFQLDQSEIDADPRDLEGQDSRPHRYFTWKRLSEGAPAKTHKLVEVYSPPLTIVFGEFMMHPLRKIDKLVQTKVMQSFIQNQNLFDHFHNVRAHVLLGAGDFAHALVGQIEGAARTSEANEKYIQRRVNAAMTFYGTSGAGGRYLRDRTLLNRCLRTALNLYSRKQNAYADLLLLDSEGHAGEGEGSSRNNSLWDQPVEFKYNVDFPLNIIFSDEVMSLYSRISDFFLRVLRAKLSLRSLFDLSRRNSIIYKPPNDKIFNSKQLQVCLWNFSWHAEHFVSIFGGFEMDQVLGTAWTEFESSWDRTKCIWDLRDAHKKFLENSIRRCLLGEKHKSVVSVMSGGFDIVVKVDKKILSVCHPDSMNASIEVDNVVDLLVSATASLKRRSIFLADVLRRLIESRAFPHLEDLLTRLDFNYFYQRKVG
eukprot:gb/GEZJ01000971.1/.p1 GENE.gb/GEZJ01000971.1/~~gb/GEZJ01000971.1/.p1  ORF type:complete len:1075 (-),score=164.51 gb/GEZJ01000971.1/:5021-8245(-)